MQKVKLYKYNKWLPISETKFKSEYW